MGERAIISARRPEANRENQVSQTQKRGIPESVNSPVDRILFLQRTIGNRAVERLFRSGLMQAKLKIGESNDIYEQEADRVADMVMRMPEPALQMKPG